MRRLFFFLPFALLISSCGTEPRIAYINTIRVYEEFELQKIKGLEYQREIERRIARLDSTGSALERKFLEAQSGAASDQDKKVLMLDRQKYLDEKQKMEAENTALLAQYSEEIWSQLNTYIHEFGVEKEYDILFGANGSGSVMHANEDLNKTDEAIAYCNNKFKGLKP